MNKINQTDNMKENDTMNDAMKADALSWLAELDELADQADDEAQTDQANGTNPASPSADGRHHVVDLSALFGDLPVVSASELMSEDPPEPSPIVDGLFERGDVGQITAPPKTKKTFLVLDLALRLAAPVPTAPGEVKTWGAFEIPGRHRVVYLNPEIKPEWLWRRLRSMAKARELKETI